MENCHLLFIIGPEPLTANADIVDRLGLIYVMNLILKPLIRCHWAARASRIHTPPPPPLLPSPLFHILLNNAVDGVRLRPGGVEVTLFFKCTIICGYVLKIANWCIIIWHNTRYGCQCSVAFAARQQRPVTTATLQARSVGTRGPLVWLLHLRLPRNTNWNHLLQTKYNPK